MVELNKKPTSQVKTKKPIQRNKNIPTENERNQI